MLFRRKPIVTEKRILLQNVNWQKLEELLHELGPERQIQLTYDRGKLEMMTPLAEHDRCNRLIESLLLVIADEAGYDLASPGKVLLSQPELGQAIQPTACYYLDKLPPGSQCLEVSLLRVAPPDLAVDVLIQEGSMKRLGLFDTLRIPEVWQYTTTVGENALKGQLTIWQWTEQGYVSSDRSPTFPFLPISKVVEFLSESESVGLAKALTLLRSWAKEAIG
ncbi:MAG: Uma2 family endonuclease [Synechococcales bacterium]|nr:Uma2 family endonuclease [Synechococcales bacterium]